MAVIVIEDWMIEKIGLKGLDLLAFALIHSCTQRGEGCWYGGYDKLAQRIGGKQRGTIEAINRLDASGLIEKYDAIIDGKLRKALRTSAKLSALSADAQNADALSAVFSLHSVQIISAQNADNNNIIKNYNKNNINIGEEHVVPPTTEKKKNRFIPPTVDDVRRYCDERRNGIDPQAFIDFYETNGWVQGRQGKPIKDWKACVRTWEKRNTSAGRVNTQNGGQSSTLDPYISFMQQIDDEYGTAQSPGFVDEQ